MEWFSSEATFSSEFYQKFKEVWGSGTRPARSERAEAARLRLFGLRRQASTAGVSLRSRALEQCEKVRAVHLRAHDRDGARRNAREKEKETARRIRAT